MQAKGRQSKNQGSFGNPQFNLNNCAATVNTGGNSANDIQEEVVSPDDVSSIYPVDQQDCYFHYSPKNSNQQTGVNTCKMNPNLNDLLECLNKSDR